MVASLNRLLSMDRVPSTSPQESERRRSLGEFSAPGSGLPPTPARTVDVVDIDGLISEFGQR